MKVYVIGRAKNYASWLPNYEIVPAMKGADLVIATGGEDWTPSYYKEPHGAYTGNNEARDAYEWAEFKEAAALNLPMVGICRGSQGMCIFAGGRLVQHQSNPTALHLMQTLDGDGPLMVTSTHHQAQYPYNLPLDEYKLLGWTDGISPFHLDGTNREINPAPLKEAEVVWYPKTRAIGIQFHPEYDMMKKHPKTLDWAIKQIKNYLLV